VPNTVTINALPTTAWNGSSTAPPVTTPPREWRPSPWWLRASLPCRAWLP